MQASAKHETGALLRAHLSAVSGYRHVTSRCAVCRRLQRLAMEPAPTAPAAGRLPAPTAPCPSGTRPFLTAPSPPDARPAAPAPRTLPVTPTGHPDPAPGATRPGRPAPVPATATAGEQAAPPPLRTTARPSAALLAAPAEPEGAHAPLRPGRASSGAGDTRAPDVAPGSRRPAPEHPGT